MHELHHRPPVAEAALERQPIHVVGEADIRRPARDRIERGRDTVLRRRELRKPIGRGIRKRRRLRVAVSDRDLVTARGKAAGDAIEIALDAAGVAESVVGDQDPHQPAALSIRSAAMVWRRSNCAS